MHTLPKSHIASAASLNSDQWQWKLLPSGLKCGRWHWIHRDFASKVTASMTRSSYRKTGPLACLWAIHFEQAGRGICDPGPSHTHRWG